MTNYEVKIKVKEDCKFHRFTDQHPDSRITYWCNEKNCVMVVESKDMDDIEDFQSMGFCCPDTKISRQGAHLRGHVRDLPAGRPQHQQHHHQQRLLVPAAPCPFTGAGNISPSTRCTSRTWRR